MENIKCHARTASNIPGRLRLRLFHPKSHPELMRLLQTSLNERPGIQQVNANHATGSVIIRYDTSTHTHDSILAMLSDIGVILHNVVAGGGPLDPDHCTSAVQITKAISDLDRRVFQLTGGELDLKSLIPLAMGILGIRQIIREGLGISEVPGCVLLWYAVDAFYRLHQQPQQVV